MQKMRSVTLCESSAASHTTGGLGQLGYATGPACQPIGESPRPASVCTVRSTGKADCKARVSGFAFPLAPVDASSSRAGAQGPGLPGPRPSPWPLAPAPSPRAVSRRGGALALSPPARSP
jgi:hypothetical protein